MSYSHTGFNDSPTERNHTPIRIKHLAVVCMGREMEMWRVKNPKMMVAHLTVWQPLLHQWHTYPVTIKEIGITCLQQPKNMAYGWGVRVVCVEWVWECQSASDGATGYPGPSWQPPKHSTTLTISPLVIATTALTPLSAFQMILQIFKIQKITYLPVCLFAILLKQFWNTS